MKYFSSSKPGSYLEKSMSSVGEWVGQWTDRQEYVYVLHLQ